MNWKHLVDRAAQGALLALSISLCVALFQAEPPTVEAVNGGDPIWIFLYNYQTLTTGILAVLAAGFTIQTMNKTDRQQQSRHDDLMALQLRPEYLALQRVVRVHLADLATRNQKAHSLVQLLQGAELPGLVLLTYAREVHDVICGTLQQLRAQEFAEAVRYADGSFTSAYRDAETLTQKHFEAVEHMVNYGGPEIHEFGRQYVDWRQRAGPEATYHLFIEALEVLALLLEALVRGLERMERRCEELGRINRLLT